MTEESCSAGDLSRFATSDCEASARHKRAKNCDPFPSIVPSLLNSADIIDYVRVTGMLFPFDEKNLKSASYEASLHGECIVWDEHGEKTTLTLDTPKDQFTLKANSIAFVEVEPFFRLPDYIALRFNLKITHVHRGILLGTGPLVDPGYNGRLLIPLHNLTNNNYVLAAEEGLIWIEFTKTSSLDRVQHVAEDAHPRTGTYIPFPEKKNQKTPSEFLHKAWPGPIRSSIPAAIEESKEKANEAAKRVEKVTSLLRNIGIFAAVALIVAIASVLYAQISLTQDAVSLVKSVYDRLNEVDNDTGAKIEEMMKRIDTLESSIKPRQIDEHNKSEGSSDNRN